MVRGAIFALALLVAGPAQAKTFRLDIRPSGDQTSRLNQGQEQITSDLPHSSILVLQPTQVSDDYGRFQVFVYNDSDRPLNFGPENIRLRYGDGKTMRMFTYAQLQKDEESRTNRKRFGAMLLGLGRAMEATQAGQYSGSGNVYSGLGGRQVGSFSYSGTDNGARYFAQQHAQAQSNADQLAVAADHAARMGALDSFVQTTTVDPGQSFGGTIAYGYPIPMKSVKTEYPVTLEITVGEDVHLITAMLEHR